MKIDWKKKYNEALEKIKRYTTDKYGCTRLKPADIFPELAESEDERIRKELSEFLREAYSRGNAPEKCAKWLVWLDESKEQKESTKEEVEPITDGLSTEFQKQVSYLIASSINKEHEYSEEYVKWVSQSLLGHAKFAMSQQKKQKEQKPLPGFDDLTPGEKMSHPIYLEGFDTGREVGRVEAEQKLEWSEEDEDFINMLILHFNYLIDKGGDSVETYKSYIEKLKSLRPQPHKWCVKKGHWYMCIVDKPEYGWTKGKVYQSPEDNRIETDYKGDLSNWPDIEPWFRPATCDEIPDNQPRWKPSEEQMGVFGRIVNDLKIKMVGVTIKKHHTLESLYNDIKKLM